MRKDIIVIGASTGGLEALKTVLGGLSGDLDASIFVVLHTSADSPGVLAQILDRAGPLQAVMVETSERIRDGVVYVARPDHHLVIEPGLVSATRGPKENRFRPAIDPLFRSAAQTYGPRVIGVVLTGALDDGTAGLWAIKSLGGTAVVQDPEHAFAPSMPRSALTHVEVDHCLDLSDIGPLLARLAAQPVDEQGGIAMPKGLQIEVDIAKARNSLDRGVLELGDPSPFACPECHGVLLQVAESRRIRFRCHTGHAYSAESLLAEINESVEDALWNAIRSLQESALLMQHLAQHNAVADDATVARLQRAARNAERRSILVRQAVMHDEVASPEDSAG